MLTTFVAAVLQVTAPPVTPALPSTHTAPLVVPLRDPYREDSPSPTDAQLTELVDEMPVRAAACRTLRAYAERQPVDVTGLNQPEIAEDYARLRAAVQIASATFCVGPLLSRP